MPLVADGRTLRLSPGCLDAGNIVLVGAKEAAGIDPSTLTRLEKSGVSAVSGRVYENVLNALKHAGVEIEGTSLRLTRKPRR